MLRGSLRPLSVWLLLLIGPIAGLAWARGLVLPTIFVPSMAVALAAVYCSGWVVQSWIDGPHRATPDTGRPRPGVFQLLWLGQYAVFLGALSVSFVAWLFSALTGVHIPLYVTLPSLVLAVCARYVVRSRRDGNTAVGPGLPSILLASVLCVALFRALALHAVHAGALGYDTQQHIYWAQHILDYGYLPLTARNTDMLETYPRLFHLLAASWSSLGLTSIVGPFLKVMPFLQSAIACGFLCELLIAVSRAPEDERADSLKALCLAVFVCWHLTYGHGQDVIRAKDLSGTPRYSAGWVEYGIPLLALAQHAGTFRDARPLLLAALPVFGAVALGINPVVLVLYLSFSLPMTLLLFLFTRRSWPSGQFAWRGAAGVGSAISAVLVASNPLVLSQLIARFPLAERALNSFGVRTIGAGLAADSWTANGAAHTDVCSGQLGECAWNLGISSARRVADTFTGMYEDSTPSVLNAVVHSRVYWAIFVLPLFVIAIRAVRRGNSEPLAPRGAPTFLALAAAVCLSQVPVELLRALLEAVAPVGPMARLLSGYYARVDLLIAPWVLCAMALASWPLVSFLALRGRGLAIATGCTVVLVGGMLHKFKPSGLVHHRMTRPEFRIDWPELRAINLLNKFVPADQAILLQSKHVVRHEYEHLMVSDDPAGMIAPHLRGRFLFGLNVGSSVDYGWADLEKGFCATPEARDELLRTAHVQWVLVRDPHPGSRATYDNMAWECGVKLVDLGAEFPPAFVERDLALFRIHPESAHALN